MYEGEDYSKASDSDKKTFDQLLAGEYIYCLRVHTIYVAWSYLRSKVKVCHYLPYGILTVYTAID